VEVRTLEDTAEEGQKAWAPVQTIAVVASKINFIINIVIINRINDDNDNDNDDDVQCMCYGLMVATEQTSTLIDASYVSSAPRQTSHPPSEREMRLFFEDGLRIILYQYLVRTWYVPVHVYAQAT
jgi:hypothetical protein